MARILVVEDDIPFAKQIAEVLKQAGHECHVENSGEGILDILANDAFDLLVLDVMLPGMSGFQICRRVHADASLYVLPILIISSMNSEEEILHGLDQGADEFLPKPVDFRQLVLRVNNLLQANEINRMTDDVTELPGSKHIKLEMQKCITKGQYFSVVYIEVMNLGKLGRLIGTEGRFKVARHMARALYLCKKKVDLKAFYAGHMGGGHFVCMIAPDALQDFCECLKAMWKNHLPTLLEQINLHEKQKESQELTIQICGTTHHPKRPRSSKQLFETLSHLRQNILKDGEEGVLIDRRN